MIAEHIFRAYDIRGVYGVDLDEKVARRVGLALGHYLGGRGRKLAVGMDVRLSSPALKKALVDGLTSAGCDVVDVGLVPSPALYYAVASMKLDGGAMVTASHNPPEWNGFKLCRKDAYIIAEGMGMEDLKALALKPDLPESGVKGRVEEDPGLLDRYIEDMVSKVKVSRRLKVVLDVANGCCSLTAPKMFEKLGCEVKVLNAELDGRFPAHLPEPTEETLAELKSKVVELGADFGVGFDGDGDRAVFVDDKGRVLLGDVVTALLVNHYLPREPGAAVVFDVSCSSIVEEAVKRLGGKPIVSRVGHAYMMDAVMRNNALLGGERSSHLYFREIWGIDDGAYAALKVAEMLSEAHEPLSALVDRLPRYPTKAKNYDCPDDVKFKAVADIAQELKSRGVRIIEVDGVKVLLDEGWFLIRPSNTQPLIKLTVEAKDEASLAKLFEEAESLIKARLPR